MPVIDDAVRDAVAIESLREPVELPAAPDEPATPDTPPAPEASAPPVRIRLVFVGLMLALLLAALDQTIVATALPRIVGELNGLSRMSWVVTAYLLASTVGLPVYGRLGDMIGRKPVFQFAIVVFLVGSVLSGLAHSMNELIAYRAIQGIGGGGLMIGVQAIIADVVTPRERGRYMGLIGAVFGLSSVAGPLLGGWFTDGPGWRWCFWVNLPVGVIALAVVTLVLPRRTPRTVGGRTAGGRTGVGRPAGGRSAGDGRAGSVVGRLDWLGALLLASVGTCLVLATSWGGSRYAWHSPVILGLIGGAVLSVALFVPVELMAERRGLAPAIPLRLFRDGVFTLSGLIGLVVGVALFGAASYLPSFLQMVDGASATGSGLKMLPLMGGVVVASIGTGQLISRTGRYKVYPILGGAFGTAGMVLLGLLDAHSSYAVQSVAMAVLGLGVGLVLPVLVLAVQNSVAPGDIGAATSANNYLRQIGGSVGAAVFGTIFSSRFAHQLAQRGLHKDDSITPELVRHLPAPLRDAYVQAFAAAMPRVFLYLAPVLALGFLLGFLLKEKPLVTHAAPEDYTSAEPLGAVPAQPATQAAAQSTAQAAAQPTAQSAAQPATGTPVSGAVLQADRSVVPRAVLTLVDLDGRQIARSGSGSDGRWALAAPRNGNYVLIAAAPGHQPQAVTVTVGGRPVELDVVLGGTGRLAGAIRSAEGAPVPGASVTLTDAHGEVVASAHADSDGAYAFRDLVSGTYTLTVSARAYRPAALAVEVAPSGETRKDITLMGSGTLRGTVRTTAGRPVADARVTLLDAAGAVVAAALTGEDGAFRFTDLEPGEYTVIAAGYPPVATALRLEDGHTERDLHLSHRLDD